MSDREAENPSDDPTEDGPEQSEEWQFTLGDLEDREAEAEAAAEAKRRREEPIEPGSPSLENVLFVLLGIALALFVISRLFVG